MGCLLFLPSAARKARIDFSEALDFEGLEGGCCRVVFKLWPRFGYLAQHVERVKLQRGSYGVESKNKVDGHR